MKKSFLLVVDVRRERRRLPECADDREFDCKFAPSRKLAVPTHLSALTAFIDRAARDGGARFLAGILAKPTHRKARTGDVSNTVP
ncbi:DUF6172 family protein [Variovorax sp. WS11]|nr:DUF6172 family protein [Variovorax sp. WS11]NDZ17276.1 hypothetical protein [Variovorax sp. WS11]